MTAPNLTRREREVALLVAQGMTNREIAGRLFISERTAESHVEQIRGKLGFRSRAQIAAWVAAQPFEGGHPAAPATGAGVPARPAASARPRRRRTVAIAASGVVVVALLAGLLFVRDRLVPAQVAGASLTPVAGTGQRAFSGDGGQAKSAALVHPVAVAIGAGGEVYIAEGNRVRLVRPDGRIATFAGTGVAGSDGDGGLAVQAQLNSPQGLAVDSAGNVYIADTVGNRIRRVGLDGHITTVAGTGEPGYAGDGQAGVLAKLDVPTGLAIGFGDSVLVADTGNNVIRHLGSDGVIRTVAGTGEAGYRGDGGPALYAVFHAPGGLALDDAGNLYIADALNERVRRIDVNGQIATVAGTGSAAFGGDGGPGIYAKLNLAGNPLEGMGQALAVGPRGDVLVADAMNHRLRRLAANGVISSTATMKTPLGVAVDMAGVIYVADGDGNRVVRIG